MYVAFSLAIFSYVVVGSHIFLCNICRRSFCTGFTLQQSQIAFSPPTSAGKALASNYTGTASFMVYKPNAVDS